MQFTTNRLSQSSREISVMEKCNKLHWVQIDEGNKIRRVLICESSSRTANDLYNWQTWNCVDVWSWSSYYANHMITVKQMSQNYVSWSRLIMPCACIIRTAGLARTLSTLLCLICNCLRNVNSLINFNQRKYLTSM